MKLKFHEVRTSIKHENCYLPNTTKRNIVLQYPHTYPDIQVHSQKIPRTNYVLRTYLDHTVHLDMSRFSSVENQGGHSNSAKLGGRTSGLDRSLSAGSISRGGVARFWSDLMDRRGAKTRSLASASVVRRPLATRLHGFDDRLGLSSLVVAEPVGSGCSDFGWLCKLPGSRAVAFGGPWKRFNLGLARHLLLFHLPVALSKTGGQKPT